MGARTCHSRISRPATSEHGSGISFIEKDDEAKRSVPTSAGRSGGDFCAAGTLILRRQGRRREEVCLLLVGGGGSFKKSVLPWRDRVRGATEESTENQLAAGILHREGRRSVPTLVRRDYGKGKSWVSPL